MNRRQFLKLTGGAGVTAALLAVGVHQEKKASDKHKWTYHRVHTQTVLELSDDDALTILGAMEPGTWGIRDAENGKKKLALTA